MTSKLERKAIETAINQEIVSNLVSLGIRQAVLSPGSRNSPLLKAFYSRKEISLTSVVDERSAAFLAVGMANQTSRPVAICCTSGSAALEYGPGLAEAYVRGLPIIALTCDRPSGRIGRNDSQTLFQKGVFDGVCVKTSFNIPCGANVYETRRTMSEAVAYSTRVPAGPVQVNIEFDDRLEDYSDLSVGLSELPRILYPSYKIPTEAARALGRELETPVKVMILPGSCAPDSRIHRALGKFASKPNVVVLSEPASNTAKAGNAISRVDACLSVIDREMLPDVVITFGGSGVSGRLKVLLAKDTEKKVKHWHIGVTGPLSYDSFDRMALRWECPASTALPQLASATMPLKGASDYASKWRNLSKRVDEFTIDYLQKCPWSDLKAMGIISGSAMLQRSICHISNGMAIRNADIAAIGTIAHRVDCNRGVSGIDGSTSTAVGASLVTPMQVLLITGDMSAAYDLNILDSGIIPDNFTMIVFDNNGGDIFRIIKATRSVAGREDLISCARRHNFGGIARAMGLESIVVSDEEELRGALSGKSRGARLIVVRTDPDRNVETFRQYFSKLKDLFRDK